MSLAMISMVQCNLLALIHILVTLNCAAHLRLTPAIMFPQQLDGAADQNNTNSPPDEPPRMSSKPNSATTKLKKMNKKEDERKGGGGDTTIVDDDLRDEIEEKGKDVDIREEKGKLIFIEEEAKSFQLNDLLKASAEGLGKGNLGNCYKAMVEGRAAVVVKQIRDLKPLSSEEFTRQMHIIAHQKHPNLPPLLAYSYSKDEQLLQRKGQDHVGGAARLSIARGIARALECLHINTTNSKSVVPHGNLKSTNVLLDWNGMVLISDRGLSSLIAQSIAAQNLVSYKPPGYQTTKKASNMSDVWSYGCLLL
ncbi:hypothetical protein Peur_002385 [Populus x canadensis]